MQKIDYLLFFSANNLLICKITANGRRVVKILTDSGYRLFNHFNSFFA